jgi:CsoR family transcriptional regulator, copper-sensing transcriptional repressor
MDNLIMENKEVMLKRLRRIEGQVKGVQKMIEVDKPCNDVITQITAIRAAISKAGLLILENYSTSCVKAMDSTEDKEKVLAELARIMQSFMKFSN